MAKSMYKHGISDAEMEYEINALRTDPMVRLGRKAERLKYQKTRQKLYQLRNLKKRGEALAAAGITWELLDCLVDDCEVEDL